MGRNGEFMAYARQDNQSWSSEVDLLMTFDPPKLSILTTYIGHQFLGFLGMLHMDKLVM